MAGSPRMYDPSFDAPAVVRREESRRLASQRTSGGDQRRRVRVPVESPSYQGILSPPGPLFLLPQVARPGYDLRLSPDSPVIVGRSNGWCPEYLDPAYQPTAIGPGTGRGGPSFRRVRQGQLRRPRAFHALGVSRGILFVNGVPRRGGGIRPPRNGTRLVAPEGRVLSPGEEYLIKSGTAMLVVLPNWTELRIDAN